MQQANTLFAIHCLCYWTMVILYDLDSLKFISESVIKSLINQFFCTLPSCYLLFYYYPIEYNNFYLSIFMIFPLILSGDIYFYFSHRPLHSSFFWKYHKTHHRGKVCVSKSLDADFCEHLFGNLGSFVIGIILMKYIGFIYNIYILYLWGAVATINTCISHSNNKCFLDDGVHTIHHKRLKCNYGTGLYLMDRFFGSHQTN